MDSSQVKQAVMKQVQQEANLVNARALIEKLQENCFEKVRPQARIFPLEQRDDLYDQLHGEVHGRLEHGQLGLYRPVKARVRPLRGYANEKEKEKEKRVLPIIFSQIKMNCDLGGSRNCTIL
ncbi:hypothetical protein CEP52_001780 [Fusarium oligoseptatum]|uniref:Uncharacterized protein n=1 Tax=Fusarium oligoseptatum TaxID=2604345 RepID=A0A428UHC9_9HYPO|nr:hypothetical protein CEP52_001780 [Fusarium oligoseptatum]